MTRATLTTAVLLALLPTLPVFGQTPIPRAYVPREGRKDPALKAEMTKLLAARGIRPTEVRIIEPEWQVERSGRDGGVRGRTINAAVVHRGVDGKSVLRYVLFRCDPARGRGLRFGPLLLADLGKPRPI